MNKIIGTSKKPRITVFRSNSFISAQFVDDDKGVTLISMSSKKIANTGKPVEKAGVLGEELAKSAKTKKITEAVFDRGAYRYHGQVKSLAEGLRKGGIKL